MEGTLSLKQKIGRLLKSHASPSEIALGIAIGVFIGCLPLYGLHLLLWIIASLLVPNANKVAMFIGTNVSLPVTIPFITWAGYELGRRIMVSHDYPPLGSEYFSNFTFKDIGSFYFPLFTGSVILGLVFALIFYGITYAAVSYRQSRRRGRHAG